jgi:RNA polymerase sigma-70 factor (ECF subfamily)
VAEHPPDIELIEALRRGDTGAAERFLQAYQERIFAFGMMVCGHREDAEDIAQESLLSALHSVAQLRSPEAFHVWLFRIVRNACYRQRRVSRHAAQAPVPLDEVPETALLAEAATEEASWPEQMLLRDETRRVVQEAISRLPAQDRLIVLLRDFENLSTEEVAQIMDLGLSATKMRLQRARQKLRRELEPYFRSRTAPPEVKA